MAVSVEEPMTAERNTETELTATFRLTEEKRRRLRLAAEATGEPVDEFIERAVMDRANAVLHQASREATNAAVTQSEFVTVVPSDYFDELIADLDEPDEPNEPTQRAARRLRQHVTWTDTWTSPTTPNT